MNHWWVPVLIWGFGLAVGIFIGWLDSPWRKMQKQLRRHD